MARYDLRPRREKLAVDHRPMVRQVEGAAQVRAFTNSNEEHDNNNTCETKLHHASDEVSPPTRPPQNPSSPILPTYRAPPAPTPQCHQVLGITEMLESILNNLSENELLRCRRISRIFNDTIRASNQLQRRLFLSPANTPHIRINPLLFHATDTVRDLTFDLRSIYDPEMFHLSACIEHYIECGRWNVPDLLDDMFITQPPIEKIRLHFRYFEARTDRPAGYGRCELSTCGGIKLKDLVTGAKETLEREAYFHDEDPDFRLHLELKNGHELV